MAAKFALYITITLSLSSLKTASLHLGLSYMGAVATGNPVSNSLYQSDSLNIRASLILARLRFFITTNHTEAHCRETLPLVALELEQMVAPAE